jgi:hypothetical protein
MQIIADPGGAVIDYVERFEAARRTPNGGRVTNPLATQVMYEVYPANVRKWIARHGGLSGAAYPTQGPRACRYGAGPRRWTRHPHPPHDPHDQVVITFGAPPGGAKMMACPVDSGDGDNGSSCRFEGRRA